MKLEIGDIVEFKKYEDMTDDENMWIGKKFFPLSGKVKEINVSGCDRYFRITGSEYIFSKESVARVISDADDVENFNPGEEVWIKATVNVCYDDTIFINPVERFLNKNDVLKTQEHFIIQESHYGMYIGTSRELVSDKSKAKIYTSQNVCNGDAADMNLDSWDVIPYGN